MPNLFIISAPSGCGKSTLINSILVNDSSKKLSVSHTTRLPRGLEQDGIEYYFVSKAEFEQKIASDDFVEYANVFDNYYGTSKQQIEQKIADGFDVILDIDWQGAQQVCQKIPQAISIFILPPSIDELERRLKKRNTDSVEVIKKRMQQAVNEIKHCQNYDYIIVNDDLDKALEQFKSILNSQYLKKSCKDPMISIILDQLLSTKV